jgi:hypothetical protein
VQIGLLSGFLPSLSTAAPVTDLDRRAGRPESRAAQRVPSIAADQKIVARMNDKVLVTLLSMQRLVIEANEESAMDSEFVKEKAAERIVSIRVPEAVHRMLRHLAADTNADYGEVVETAIVKLAEARGFVAQAEGER